MKRFQSMANDGNPNPVHDIWYGVDHFLAVGDWIKRTNLWCGRDAAFRYDEATYIDMPSYTLYQADGFCKLLNAICA